MSEMNRLKYLVKKIFGKYAAQIDQKSVIKDIYSELELSPGYFMMLNLANLIALSGLLVNSIAVIIGAMLISPLMGPMISFGFSFVTGDNIIWRKSLKKLILSVVITILIAALATYLSPLNDVTSEILSRTKPNLFDLIIAFLAGSAGAVAICTKKNYLTVVPGVAIATAVIPPLSVTGFGLGVGDLSIATGGFFLFFTNFVAIVITSCLVFFFYGFRPFATGDVEKSKLNRRIVLLLLLLCTISIPLVYTLGVTISEAKLKKDIKTVLHDIYDKKGLSRVSTFSYYKHEKGMLEIDAAVKTVHNIKNQEILSAEKIIRDRLQRNVRLNLEQEKVVKGGLEDETTATRLPIITPAAVPPAALVKKSREEILEAVKVPVQRVEETLSPSQVVDYSVRIGNDNPRLFIRLKIRRDTPLSGEQIQWLGKILASELKYPVELSVDVVPFIPPLVFKTGDIALDEGMKEALHGLKEIYQLDPRLLIVVESGPEASLPYRERIAAAGQRAEAVSAFLNTYCQIPPAHIELKRMSKAMKIPVVRVSVYPAERRPSQ